jgi:hypothetical protein
MVILVFLFWLEQLNDTNAFKNQKVISCHRRAILSFYIGFIVISMLA